MNREKTLARQFVHKRRLTIILLLAGGIAALLAYQLRSRLLAPAGALPQLVERVPGDSSFIAYIDLTELRKEPLISRIAALAAPVAVERDYADFVNATGFDYRRDLDRVAIAMNSRGTLALADGRFDQRKIKQYALRSGKLEHDANRDIYVIPATAPEQGLSLAFVSKNRIAIARGGDLAAELSRPITPLNPEMRQRLMRVAGSPTFAGMSIREETMRSGTAAAGVTIPALQTLRGINFAIQPNEQQLLIIIEGECDNSTLAQNLASNLDLLRGLLPTVLSNSKGRTQMTAANAELLKRLLESSVVSAEDTRVRLLVTVTPEMLADSQVSTPP